MTRCKTEKLRGNRGAKITADLLNVMLHQKKKQFCAPHDNLSHITNKVEGTCFLFIERNKEGSI